MVRCEKARREEFTSKSVTVTLITLPCDASTEEVSAYCATTSELLLECDVLCNGSSNACAAADGLRDRRASLAVRRKYKRERNNSGDDRTREFLDVERSL